MNKKELVCIICPRGCNIISKNNKVYGYNCLEGKKFGEEEFKNPKRTLTTTISIYIRGQWYGELPVKTSEPISRERLFDVMKLLSSIYVTPPVRMGEVIVEDLLNTGVSLIATQQVA